MVDASCDNIRIDGQEYRDMSIEVDETYWDD